MKCLAGRSVVRWNKGVTTPTQVAVKARGVAVSVAQTDVMKRVMTAYVVQEKRPVA